MNIATIGQYTNSQFQYNQRRYTSTDLQAETSTILSQSNSASQRNLAQLLKGQNSSSTSASQSLTDQLSGLVRLVRYAMDSMGLEKDSRVTFSKLNDYCEQVQERFTSAVKDGLANAAIDPAKVTYTLNTDGSLQAHSGSSFAQAMATLAIDKDPTIGTYLQKQLEEAGIPVSYPFTFSLDASGAVTATGMSTVYEQQLKEQNVTFPLLAEKIADVHLDPDIDFTIKIADDDSLSVNAADSKYNPVLKAFFEENPSIVADYKRTEALSGIEAARKSMSLSPSDMRTRLQIESIAAWWDTSSNNSASSWFGSYTNGSFLRRSGVNINV